MIRYVLLNVRKHFLERHGHAPPVRIDAASSASQFDGWSHYKNPQVELAPIEDVGVTRAASWLLRTGWRKLGLIELASVPG